MGRGVGLLISTQPRISNEARENRNGVLVFITSKRQSNGKEFDTYKVGTTANSTSTMHKLASTPITLDCFETDDFCRLEDKGGRLNNIIQYLEWLRQKYLGTKDKKFWKELIRWLPESWLQTRTVTMSYENLLAMCSKGQRRFHKLNEWSGVDNPSCETFINFARSLPYSQHFIFLDELAERDVLDVKIFVKL